MERKLLTPTEAAKYLGIKVSYLYKLMMRRAIPYYKPGGKLCFFEPADLDRWLHATRVASDEELDNMAQSYIVRNSTPLK